MLAPPVREVVGPKWGPILGSPECRVPGNGGARGACAPQIFVRELIRGFRGSQLRTGPRRRKPILVMQSSQDRFHHDERIRRQPMAELRPRDDRAFWWRIRYARP